jgi:hypothetical protein
MLGYACNPSTEEAKAGGLQIKGQPGLYSQKKSELYQVK